MQEGATHSRYLAGTLLRTGEELGWEWKVRCTVKPVMGPWCAPGEVSDSAPMPVVIIEGKPPPAPRWAAAGAAAAALLPPPLLAHTDTGRGR